MDIRKLPGTALKNQMTGAVIYTPPLGEQTITELLSNWEKFIHQNDDLDPLVKLALTHYQFEATHPFTADQMGLELNEEQQKMSGFGSFKRVMDTLETGLANADPYICGKQLTAVDIYVGYFLLFLAKHNLIEISPVMNSYLTALSLNPELKAKMDS